MQERAKSAQHIYQSQNSTEKHLETLKNTTQELESVKTELKNTKKEKNLSKTAIKSAPTF